MNTQSQSLQHPAAGRGVAHSDAVARTTGQGTLAHLFCDDNDFGDEEFVPAVMRSCVARRALPIFAIFGRGAFFAPDRELIRSVAQALTMEDVEAAIDDFWSHPANRSWLRRVAGVRLSTQRLRRFAAGYLPLEDPQKPRLRRRSRG